MTLGYIIHSASLTFSKKNNIRSHAMFPIKFVEYNFIYTLLYTLLNLPLGEFRESVGFIAA